MPRPQWTSVQCSDCRVIYNKWTNSLATWKGRCRSCAQKLEKNKPEMIERISKSARHQVLAQGGIPNARKFNGLNNVGSNHPNWKGGKPTCPDCGKTLSTRQSKRCTQCSPRSRSGPNHPRWKGGITEATHKIRTSTPYKEWRMAVFQRDHFTCVNCNYRSKKSGNKPCDIRADHIQPFSLFPELRLAVDNGRTLCIPCDKLLGFHYHRDRKLARGAPTSLEPIRTVKN